MKKINIIKTISQEDLEPTHQLDLVRVHLVQNLQEQLQVHSKLQLGLVLTLHCLGAPQQPPHSQVCLEPQLQHLAQPLLLLLLVLLVPTLDLVISTFVHSESMCFTG